MILELSFSPAEHKKLMRQWQQHYDKLRQAYEPVYHISGQRFAIDAEGRKLLLTDWVNGRPTIMPPADLVSLILYDEGRQTLVNYLIEQPSLFEYLGKDLSIEQLPTRFFQLERLSEQARGAIVLNAQLVGEKRLELQTA